MKIKTLLLGLLLVALFSCKQTNPQVKTDIDKEIAQLVTDEDKRKFLEGILEDDQKVRNSEGADLMLKYGKDSKEYMDYAKVQWKQDEINLTKIEKYFEKYGYPSKELGSDAIRAPWMVLHHQTDLDKRNRNFDLLYQAYLEGDLDGGSLSFFLGRTYEFTFGKRLKMENPFTSKDEINQLIKELKLQK